MFLLFLNSFTTFLVGGGIRQAEKSDEDIKELLKQTFVSAERGYITSIDSLLATKQQLQFQILDLTQFEISQKYQDVRKNYQIS